MRGLWKKDLLLVRNQKKLLLLLAFCVLYPVLGMDSFCIQFLAMMGLIIATGTISYDEFDNGNPFLFTLPFSRRDYVKEKYLLSTAFTLAGICLGVISVWIVGLVTHTLPANPLWSTAALSLLWIELTGFVMLPIWFKFGVERGRTAAYLVLMLLVLAVAFAGKLVPRSTLAGLARSVEQVPVWLLAAGMIVLLLLVGGISITVSQKYLERKEF